MLINTDGLILREQDIGENDLLVTVLTRHDGVIRAFVKNPKNGKKSSAAASRTLCYSQFILYKGKDKYIINSAEPIHVFFDIRKDLDMLALSQYFSDIAIHVVPENMDSEGFLRLILNSLHYLGKGQRNLKQIKSIYEMRVLAMAGYMPDLVCCGKCHKYESEKMYFLFKEGKIFCENCYKNEFGSATPINGSVLHSLRYIIYSEFDKVFSFSLSDSSLKTLSDVSERYLLLQLERGFKSLDFYHQIQTV